MFECNDELTRNKFLANKDISLQSIKQLGYAELINYKNITH